LVGCGDTNQRNTCVAAETTAQHVVGATTASKCLGAAAYLTCMTEDATCSDAAIKTELEELKFYNYEELFDYYALIALILMFSGFLLQYTLLKSIA
jgi:hypothetical protein